MDSEEKIKDVCGTNGVSIDLQSNEKQYFIVDGKLININDMKDFNESLESPLAMMAKQNLDSIIQKVTCMNEDDVSYFRSLDDVNPYEPLSQSGQVLQDYELCLHEEEESDCSQKDIECKQKIQYSKIRESCQICPKCFTNLDCLPKETPCPLCETIYNPCQAEKQLNLNVSSLSDELHNIRLEPSSSFDLPSQRYSYCLKNKEKCSDFIKHPRMFRKRFQESIVSLINSDIKSNSVKGYSRYSMYDSPTTSRRGRSVDYLKKIQPKYERKRESVCQSRITSRKGVESQDNGDKKLNNKEGGKFKAIVKNLQNLTSEEQLKLVQKKLRAKRKKPNLFKTFKSKYSYLFGKRYTGTNISHQECLKSRELVPSRMGWLWNIPILGINQLRKGWKPGAVAKPVKELMMHFLMNYPCDTLPITKPQKKSIYTELETPCMHPCDHPTLQVKKTNGEFTISFNPLKDSNDLQSGENPYLECSPVTFKIQKDQEAYKLDQCRKKLLSMGFLECTCEDPCHCYCRTAGEKELLKWEMNCLSYNMGLKTKMQPKDFVKEKDEEAKDLNIEFSPPSALIGKKPKQPKKDTTVQGTQYNHNDYIVHIPADKDLIKNRDKVFDKSDEGEKVSYGKSAIQYQSKQKDGRSGIWENRKNQESINNQKKEKSNIQAKIKHKDGKIGAQDNHTNKEIITVIQDKSKNKDSKSGIQNKNKYMNSITAKPESNKIKDDKRNQNKSKIKSGNQEINKTIYNKDNTQDKQKNRINKVGNQYIGKGKDGKSGNQDKEKDKKKK